jgi:hypothetical protein
VNANESMNCSQFKIHLQAGHEVVVPGSMITNIRSNR